MAVIPRALGYGRARPVRVWDAVAEVGGRIVEIHPRLRKGALIEENELLVRIDPTEYELAVSQVQADILSTRAQLSEMAVKEANTRLSCHRGGVPGPARGGGRAQVSAGAEAHPERVRL